MQTRNTNLVTVQVPCPECGELSLEPIAIVADNDVIPCSLYGGLIDRKRFSDPTLMLARGMLQSSR
jgi:hypothetical protein